MMLPISLAIKNSKTVKKSKVVFSIKLLLSLAMDWNIQHESFCFP